MQTQNNYNCRDMASVSMFNPLYYGDFIELNGDKGGEVWVVKNSGCGWQLRAVGDNRLHPTIHDIFGMDDFIGAILEYTKNT